MRDPHDPMPGAGFVGKLLSIFWDKILVPLFILGVIAGVTAWLVYRITRNEQAAQVAAYGVIIAGVTGIYFLK